MSPSPAFFRQSFAIGASVLTLLSVGCSSGDNSKGILENDSDAVIALKNAGAKVGALPVPGQPEMARSIDLSGIVVTPELFSQVLFVDNILELTLNGPEVTDAEIELMGGMRNLSLLDLSGTAVTAEGLALLSRNQTLSSLTLNDTQITGKDLDQLPPVQTLGLANLAIGDDDLHHLDHMTDLRFLNLIGTSVTAAGVRSLREKHPGLIVMGIKVE